MKLRVEVARRRADVLRCQYLIAEVYNREYEVVFSDDRFDLEGKVEPWPHRYLMGTVGGELAATCGLYLRDTYVERFGGVHEDDVAALLAAAGAGARYHPARKREITKIVVAPAFRGLGLGRTILAAASSRAFLEQGTGESQLLVACSVLSLWENLWHRSGIRTRVIKPFPYYKVHELYRSEQNPMDSRLVIPDLDVPPRWYDLSVPGEVELEQPR